MTRWVVNRGRPGLRALRRNEAAERRTAIRTPMRGALVTCLVCLSVVAAVLLAPSSSTIG